jgi:hypothetical protein
VLQVVHRDVASRANVDVDRLKELDRNLTEAAQESVRLFDAVAETRIDWLADRITSIAPGHPALSDFEQAHRIYTMARLLGRTYIEPFSSGGDFVVL